jgi:hypothetical protein
MQYLDADDPENLLLLAGTVGGLDRNAITLDNTVNLAPNEDSIFTAVELFPDPTIDNPRTWWEKHWRTVSVVIFLAVVVLLVVIAIICPPIAIKMLIAGGIAAVNGFIIGGGIAAYQSYKRGDNTWDIIVSGLDGGIHGAMNGFATGVIMSFAFGVGPAIKAAKAAKIANAAKMKAMVCFIEGTLVLTEEGHKRIEDIKEGDKVWTYDEETGKTDWKEVLQLY